MSNSSFDLLQSEFSSGGADAVLEKLAKEMRDAGRYHDLFDVRLMQARYKLNLPLIASASIEEFPEEVRDKAEEAYLQACEEVGQYFLEEEKFREAWMYLRPAGKKEQVAAEIEKAEIDDDSLEEVIEVALHEGVTPLYGFSLVLQRYGTCNAITLFEGSMPTQPISVQIEAADMLIEHLYQELTGNVRANIEDHEGEAPPEDMNLAQMSEKYPWLFDEENYHIDTSHLAAIVRFARLTPSPESIRRGYELCEYGCRLAEMYLYEGEPPFEKLYETHRLFFLAELGEQVDSTVELLRTKAQQSQPEADGLSVIETYLILLDRLGRYEEAMEAQHELVPHDLHVSAYAPKFFELAQKSGNLDRFLEICRQRNDLLAFAAGMIESTQEPASKS